MTTTYNNMFISYFSPETTKTLASYINENNLGGTILWEIRGDTDVTTKDSLLLALNENLDSQRKVMGYWTNWSAYSGTTAIPYAGYPITGSQDTSSKIVTNKDWNAKIEKCDFITYAFLEAQSKQIAVYDNATGVTSLVDNPYYADLGGTLYFNDPWADLLPQEQGKASSLGKFYDDKNMIAWFLPKLKNQPILGSSMMGNFDAFAKTTGAKKLLSIGGYGHDNSFEDTLGNLVFMDNFVSSACELCELDGVDGIDLDYENPDMTWQQSRDYLKLIKELYLALGNDKYINITILAGQNYLNGTIKDKGFAPGVLAAIADYADQINLMTYDFHGAFDYSGDVNSSRTGFLTNVYPPENAPSGYEYKFSIQDSVNALLNQGIPSTKISVGVPAYGRALSNIDKGDTNGLYRVITSNTTIPQGDLDSPVCSMGITPLNFNSCSGSFQYNYILNNMLTNGFTQTITEVDGKANGVSAYCASWSPTTNKDKIVIINNNGAIGFTFELNDASTEVFGPSDYIAPSVSKTYNSTSYTNTLRIPDNVDLNVVYSTYAGGPSGVLSQAANFGNYDTAEITVSIDNQGKVTSEVSMYNKIN